MLDLLAFTCCEWKRRRNVGGSQSLWSIKSRAFYRFHAQSRRFCWLTAFNALLSGMLCDCRSRHSFQLSPTIPERFTNFLPGLNGTADASARDTKAQCLSLSQTSHFVIAIHLWRLQAQQLVFICHAWTVRSLITFFCMRTTYVNRTAGQSDREKCFRR